MPLINPLVKLYYYTKTEETIDNLKTILGQMPAEFRRTMTFGNGSEFTNHEQLQESFGLKTYFCDTYASWQKGGVENANGILRRYLPKAQKRMVIPPKKCNP